MKFVAVKTELPSHRPRNLVRIIQDLRFLDRDEDGRVKQRIAVVHSLHTLHEVALARLFDEEVKMVIHEPAFDSVPNLQRLDCFQLECVGKRQLAERERKRADAVRAERFEEMVLPFFSFLCHAVQAEGNPHLRVGKDSDAVLERAVRVSCRGGWHGDPAMRVPSDLDCL